MKRRAKRTPKPYCIGETADAVQKAQDEFSNAEVGTLAEHVALATLTLLGPELVRAVADYRERL